MRSILCTLGFHDWRLSWGSYAGREQCRWCDAERPLSPDIQRLWYIYRDTVKWITAEEIVAGAINATHISAAPNNAPATTLPAAPAPSAGGLASGPGDGS